MASRKQQNDVVSLPVTDGGSTLVDRATAVRLDGRTLYAKGQGYVKLRDAGRVCWLHRFATRAPADREVHHVNGDPRDNRLANLMVLEGWEHKLSRAGARSATGWRGSYRRPCGRHEARLIAKRQLLSLGGFASGLLAAFCRDDMLRRVTRLRSGLNFPYFVDAGDVGGLMSATRGALFAVWFVRRSNGALRKMVCRTGVRKDQKGRTLAFDPKDRGLLSVYDVHKRAYRFIPVENVLCLTWNGKRYRVVHKGSTMRSSTATETSCVPIAA